MIRNPKVRKFLNRLIQAGLFLACIIFLYFQLLKNEDSVQLHRILQNIYLQPGIKKYFLFALVLMPVNWILEVLKWRYLISKVEAVSLFRAIKAVLTGITISIFTPNRTGEYFGRVFLLRNTNPVDGILITLVGSMAQLLITIIAGSASFIIFVLNYPVLLVGQHRLLFMAIIVTISFFNFLIIALYYNISLIRPVREQFWKGMLSKVRHYFRVFTFYHRRELSLTLLVSAGRYMVFSTQFYFLLIGFGVPLTYFIGLMLIALIFLVMTMIPTVALTELGVRTSAAIYFISFWLEKTNPGAESVNTGVFAATLLLWFINLAVPALLGSAFIFHLRFFRKTTSSQV